MATMALVEEGTVNLHTSPVTPSGSSWTTFAANSGFVVFTDDGIDGAAAAELECLTAGWFGRATPYINVVAGQTYTFSVWFKNVSAATFNPLLRVEPRNGTTPLTAFNGGAVVETRGAWSRWAYTFAAPADATNLRVAAFIQQGLVGDKYRLSAPQLEQKGYPTSFCPARDGLGVLQPGNQWNGTPDASASTRTVGTIRVPVAGHLSSLSGAIAMAVRIRASGGSTRYLFGVGSFGTNDFIALRCHTGVVHLWVRTGTSAVNEINSTIPNASVRSVYAAWSPTQLWLQVNSEPVLTIPRTPAPSGVTSTHIGIGDHSVHNLPAGGWYGSVAMFDRPLTDAERSRLIQLIEANQLDWYV